MKLNNEAKVYYGNIVYPDGRIFNAIGKQLEIKNGVVRLYIDGKKRTLMAARVVYEAVTGEPLSRGKVIQFKDGNKDNASFDNIVIIERTKYFEDHQWQRKLTKEEELQLVAEYCVEDSKYHGKRKGYDKPSYRDLAEKYNCSKSLVYNILRKYNKVEQKK